MLPVGHGQDCHLHPGRGRVEGARDCMMPHGILQTPAPLLSLEGPSWRIGGVWAGWTGAEEGGRGTGAVDWRGG
eukprot:3512344-Pyramimonas_sp.AAC.1